jgi:hypothetical protein
VSAPPPAWTAEFYEEKGREPVLEFLRGLDELKEQALAAALSNVLAYEDIGVCGSSWGKWIAGAPGIFEFRVRHDAATILRERGLPVPEHLEAAGGASCCASSVMRMAARSCSCWRPTTRARNRAQSARTRRSPGPSDASSFGRQSKRPM